MHSVNNNLSDVAELNNHIGGRHQINHQPQIAADDDDDEPVSVDRDPESVGQPSPLSSAANNVLWTLQSNTNANPLNSSPPVTLPSGVLYRAGSAVTAGAGPAVQPSSVINLSNSSNVVIGQRTNYQGPVTIYQYMDATVEARSMQANGAGGINRVGGNASVKSSPPHNLTLTSKLLIVLIVVVLIVAAVVVYIEVQRSAERRLQQTKPAEPILFGNNYEHGTFPNLGNGHLIIDRQQWGASELVNKLTVPLKHPIPYVLITHIGVQSVPCHTVYKCSIKMRTIQDSAVAEKNLPDIQANFYVGDDGNIYVGRGWDYANTYANDTLAVSFMGDYGRYIPTDRQMEAAKHLLAHALTSRYLELSYKLVAANQTKSTKSPGANVYRIIKQWPHFYPCGMDGNPRCGSELGMPDVWNANM